MSKLGLTLTDHSAMKEKILPESQQTSRFDKVWKTSFLVLFQNIGWFTMLGRRDCIVSSPRQANDMPMSQESDQNLEAMLSSLQEISETSLGWLISVEGLEKGYRLCDLGGFLRCCFTIKGGFKSFGSEVWWETYGFLDDFIRILELKDQITFLAGDGKFTTAVSIGYMQIMIVPALL